MLERCAEESKGTERTDSVAEQAGLNPTAWTPDEQKLLEQVRTFSKLGTALDSLLTKCFLNMFQAKLCRPLRLTTARLLNAGSESARRCLGEARKIA